MYKKNEADKLKKRIEDMIEDRFMYLSRSENRDKRIKQLEMENLALQDQLLLTKDPNMPRDKMIEQVRVIKDFSLAVYNLYAKYDG